MQKRNKKILFFPQNKTHIDNMIPVAEQLSLKGYKVFFFDTSEVYNQYIYESDFKFDVIKLSLSLKTAFAYLSFVEKIKFLMQFKDVIKDYNLNTFDAFIYGNDGALQRVIIDKFKDKSHLLILDGIISDYSFSLKDVIRHSENKMFDVKDYFRRIFKKGLNKIFAFLPYNYLLPSDVGCSRLSKIFVISDYVASHINKQIIRKVKLVKSGMPRYRFLNKVEAVKSNKKQLLYVTQGYIWHNEFENDRLQHKTIKILLEKLAKEQVSDIHLTIRIHPRDDIKNYSYVPDLNWVTLEDKSVDVYKSIKEKDIVIGVNSTVLLEAMSIGKKVIFLFLDNQYWRFKNSFINNDLFIKAFSTDQLLEHIFSTKEKENISIAHFFQPNANESVKIIVNEVEQVL